MSEAAAVPLVPICAVGGGGATIATPTTVTLPFLEQPITNHIPEGLKANANVILKVTWVKSFFKRWMFSKVLKIHC